jgi:hypothetical protein
MSRNDRKCDEMRFTHLKIYYGLERTRCVVFSGARGPIAPRSHRAKPQGAGAPNHQASERTMVRIVCVRAGIKRIGSKTKGMSYLI